MNDIIKDMDEHVLMHYGMPRRSGRYPWGSGKDPYQRTGDFMSRVDDLRKQNFTYTDENGKIFKGDTAIAKSMGLSTTQFRTEYAIAKNERRLLQVNTAKALKKDGLGATEIGRKMGISESSVRSLLNAKSEEKMKQAKETAKFIKEQVDKKGMIDVGTGVERELNISKEKLNQALYLLEREGYPIYKGGIPQVTNIGNQTNQKIICKPGTQHKEIYQYDKVHALNEDNYISRDDGKTFEKKFHYPESMDSNRLMIRYREDGGMDCDGVAEIRPGVKDLSLGESRYSQVRIMVDGKKYIKGMAVYGDPKDFPPGVDVIFNTNKSKTVSKMDVLKDVKSDPDNPFGALIKDATQGGQYWYDDPKTGEKKLGLINKTREEGDWSEWKDSLPSQFLAKQPLQLIDKQLKLAIADKESEYSDIMAINNPTVKKYYLKKFADDCDSTAVHLKAAALPGQKYHVIIPNNTLKDTEVYAPGYEQGSKLALVRYPHGGTFEIPICTVNNKNPLGKKLIGSTSIDAICVNSKVAERLSGADFDGDTVMCIPTHDKKGNVKITSTPPLKGLEGFDPKMEYPERPGMKYMKNPKTGSDNTQNEMGRISNLISDMTLLGANDDELAAAVRHSMVVIDAAKHKLDYKKSEIDNNIAGLKKKYQEGGASTLISRAKSKYEVPKRQGNPKVNIKGKPYYDPSRPEGALLYKTADNINYTKVVKNKRTGELKTIQKTRTQNSTKMAETDDAYTLVSKQRDKKELKYAEYANKMKSMANQARVESEHTGKIAYSRLAKAEYQDEVKSLNEKLNKALLNSPKERQAQRLSNAEMNIKKQNYYEENNAKMKTKDIKKASQQAISKYRDEVGSVSRRNRSIEITPKEWEAIQKGAISENVLNKILNNSDPDKLRELATPKAVKELNSAKIGRIKAMASSNYTIEQIAKKLGVSKSTVSKYLK